jgi:hypothetical protein
MPAASDAKLPIRNVISSHDLLSAPFLLVANYEQAPTLNQTFV